MQNEEDKRRMEGESESVRKKWVQTTMKNEQRKEKPKQ